MKVVAMKVLDCGDSADLERAIANGYRLFTESQFKAGDVELDIPKASSNGNGHAVAEKVVRRGKKRRSPQPVTPEVVKQMTELRKKGMIWRIIGRRFGVSGGRAWQIVNQGR